MILINQADCVNCQSFPIRIHTPAPHQGIYHGLELQCVGIAHDDLLMVPLPAVADRPPYMGLFRPEYVIRLDLDEVEYANF